MPRSQPSVCSSTVMTALHCVLKPCQHMQCPAATYASISPCCASLLQHVSQLCHSAAGSARCLYYRRFVRDHRQRVKFTPAYLVAARPVEHHPCPDDCQCHPAIPVIRTSQIRAESENACTSQQAHDIQAHLQEESSNIAPGDAAQSSKHGKAGVHAWVTLAGSGWMCYLAHLSPLH